MAKESPNHHETLTGREPSQSQDRTLTSKLHSDDNSFQIPPQSLAEFREREGRANRKQRLYALWQHVCRDGYLSHENRKTTLEDQKVGSLTPDKAEKLRAAYEDELLGRCGAQSSRKQIGWTEFKNYAEAKETGTWPSLDASRPLNKRTVLQSSGTSFTMSSIWMVMGPWTLRNSTWPFASLVSMPLTSSRKMTSTML